MAYECSIEASVKRVLSDGDASECNTRLEAFGYMLVWALMIDPLYVIDRERLELEDA